MTRFISLIGYPLKHSLSPAFQQAALDHFHLDINYETWETLPELLQSTVDRLRQPSVVGANVTVPYKERVLDFVDVIDDRAKAIGAVNTIVSYQGRLKGYNTDAEGFLRGLSENAKFDPGGRRAIILGAGGAARAVCFALLRTDVGSLVIANRTAERAEALAKAIQEHVSEVGKMTDVSFLPWGSSQLCKAVQNSQLIINCTTMGMRHSLYESQSPLARDWIPQHALIYDLVYNPPETPLLREASKAGASALNGLPMLVYQGAASFELWTTREAPLDIMFDAVRMALS